VLDGSNLARLLPGSCLQSIDRVVAALAGQHPGHACVVLCDPSLRRQVGALDRDEFERRLRAGWQETPPGTPADVAILALARELHAVVVSRDRYREHAAARLDVPVLAVSTEGDAVVFGPALMHGSDATLRRVDVDRHLALRTKARRQGDNPPL
jgi:hypothetical protein